LALIPQAQFQASFPQAAFAMSLSALTGLPLALHFQEPLAAWFPVEARPFRARKAFPREAADFLAQVPGPLAAARNLNLQSPIPAFFATMPRALPPAPRYHPHERK